MLPRVIIVECDHGAVWPTWTPASHEPPESGRTDHVPFGRVPLTKPLRKRLRAWQEWWETMVWPYDEEPDVNEGEWRRFIAEGRDLVEALQQELGDGVEVRLGFGRS